MVHDSAPPGSKQGYLEIEWKKQRKSAHGKNKEKVPMEKTGVVVF